MREVRLSVAAVAALVAGSAAAQSVAFHAPPVTLPGHGAGAFASAAPWGAGPALLLGLPGAAGAAQAWAYAPGGGGLQESALLSGSQVPAAATSCFAAGSWTSGTSADLAWCSGTGLLADVGGASSPYALYATGAAAGASGVGFAHLLERAADVAVAGTASALWAVDSGPSWSSLAIGTGLPDSGPTVAIQPLRLSPLARGAAGPTAPLQDVGWSRDGVQNFYLVWTLAAATTLAPASYAGKAILFSGAQGLRGAASVDYNGDGVQDLLVCTTAGGVGGLAGLPNDGALADFGNVIDTLGGLLGSFNPGFLAPLDLDGVPAALLWDGNTNALVVATSLGAGQFGFMQWTAPAPARGQVVGAFSADVLGSPAADLVVLYADGSLDVFAGDLPPSVAWGPGSPPASVNAALPLSLQVLASDPDGPAPAVQLFLGAQTTAAAALAAPPYAFTLAPGALCGLAPSAALRVRATDDLGVWREVAGAVAVDTSPLVTLGGDGQVVRLLPGGTRFAVQAQAVSGCGGAPALSWAAPSDLPAGAVPQIQVQGSSGSYAVELPESTYPELLARADLTLAATVQATSSGQTSSATARIALDPSGLVAVDQTSDRQALGAGDLALLTATLRSDLSVALPGILVEDRLDGLEPAGAPTVRGATLAGWTRTASGVAVTLQALPGGGAAVAIDLPVRRTLAPAGASAVRAVAPASGAALSAEAQVAPGDPTLPGLGCASGGEGGALGLALVGLALGAGRRARPGSRGWRGPGPVR